jgi:1,4-dihydroxy-2-naphthoyl-CoA hydrolase
MTAIWTKPVTIEILTDLHRDTAVSLLGMEFTELGDDFIRGRVPVDRRTCQPMGLLHGGVSVVLAETLGSCGAAFSCALDSRAVGLDVNANHLRGPRSGWVTGTARPVHIGRATHVWQIELFDDDGRLVCTSRLTAAIVTSRP